MIKKFCDMVERFLAGQYDPLRFSAEFPRALVEYGDEAEMENAKAMELFEQDIPEICADYERGENPDLFMRRIRAEYEKVKKVL